MKLLIFIQSLAAGGAERVAVNLANHWASMGRQVTLVTLSDQDADFYVLDPAVQRFAMGLAAESSGLVATLVNNAKRVAALRRILRSVAPDVAVAMMSNANILLAMARVGLKGMVAIGSERTYPPQMPLGRLREALRRYWYGRLCAVTALTSEGADWLRAHTRARKVAVVPNPVPWPLPRQEPVIPASIPGRSGRKTLLAVGRLSEEKRLGLLIDAFAGLADAHPGWDLVILGQGDQYTALTEHAARLALSGRVLIPGRAGNVGDWYASADLFVMTSRFEGFPNALAEAMAHGLPAVSFDCDTGPRDIVRHGVDGLLVASGDTAALRAALHELMADDALRRQYAGAAVDVRSRFSVERVNGMWDTLFSALGADTKAAAGIGRTLR